MDFSAAERTTRLACSFGSNIQVRPDRDGYELSIRAVRFGQRNYLERVFHLLSGRSRREVYGDGLAGNQIKIIIRALHVEIAERQIDTSGKLRRLHRESVIVAGFVESGFDLRGNRQLQSVRHIKKHKVARYSLSAHFEIKNHEGFPRIAFSR